MTPPEFLLMGWEMAPVFLTGELGTVEQGRSWPRHMLLIPARRRSGPPFFKKYSQAPFPSLHLPASS